MKYILVTFFILIVTIIFFEFIPIDYLVQDNLFNTSTHTWILDNTLEPYRLIFYDGMKKVLILFAVSLLIFSLLFYKSDRVQAYKQGIIIVILSAILVPLIVGGLKKYTNMPCPKNEIHYGGKMPRTAVWQSYTPVYKKMDCIKCWPAGHASGGFALLSLFFLFKTKKNKKIALGVALSVGWSMGVYKMLIGDHFLSHTFITMILAWFIVLILARLVYFKNPKICN